MLHSLKQNIKLLLVGLCVVLMAPPVMAQTKTAKGINTGSSAIGILVPEVGNLESQVLESTALMGNIQGCGQQSRFYDPNTGDCRTTDPVSVVFSNGAGGTRLRIQNPDGSFSTYDLDGAEGNVVVSGTPVGPVTPPVTPPDPPPGVSCTTPWGATVADGATVTAYSSANYPCQSQVRTCNNGTLSGAYTNRSCRERWICKRNGVTWTQGGDAEVPGRLGMEVLHCCEGVPESELRSGAPIAGYTARIFPNPRTMCP